MRVFGFDPGYGLTGWGVVEPGQAHNSFRSVDYGAISTEPGAPMPERLRALYQAASELLLSHSPQYIVVEQLFVNRNLKTVGEVYQARGVLLLAAAQTEAEILTVNPASVKQMITGSGRASKRDVTLMVQRLLGITKAIRPDDAADALAGALCGSFLLRGGLGVLAGRV